jgi:hypothetical protein
MTSETGYSVFCKLVVLSSSHVQVTIDALIDRPGSLSLCSGIDWTSGVLVCWYGRLGISGSLAEAPAHSRLLTHVRLLTHAYSLTSRAASVGRPSVRCLVRLAAASVRSPEC